METKDKIGRSRGHRSISKRMYTTVESKLREVMNERWLIAGWVRGQKGQVESQVYVVRLWRRREWEIVISQGSRSVKSCDEVRLFSRVKLLGFSFHFLRLLHRRVLHY